MERINLTIFLLNKLRCHTHFSFSANQITWSRLLIQIHILNAKQCSAACMWLSCLVALKIWKLNWNSADPDQKTTDLELHCLQRQSISGFSRTRVSLSISNLYLYLTLTFCLVNGLLKSVLKMMRRPLISPIINNLSSGALWIIYAVQFIHTRYGFKILFSTESTALFLHKN